MSLSTTPTAADERQPSGSDRAARAASARAVSARPSAARRTALVLAGVAACALPAVFTVSITGLLLTQTDADHRFHQLTGQGLVLFALWVGGLLPLLRAGWSGRRPSLVAAWLHLIFVLVGVACAAAAPGGGAPILVAVVVVTGALVWSALPVRPSLTLRRLRLDPVLTPIALMAAALYTPYALDQISQQNQAVGHHAVNPHLFDMAWMVMVLVLAAVVAGLVEPARRLVLWTALGSVAVGAAGLACGEPVTWSLLALGLGVLATAGYAVRSRLGRNL